MLVRLYIPKYKHVSFNIEIPQSGGWFYRVYVFNQRLSMYKFRAELQIYDKAPKLKNFDFAAIVSSYISKYKGNEKQIGTILFWKNRIGCGIVAHEICHAANYYWRALRQERAGNIFKNAREDENFAYILGELVSQFWNSYYKYFES